MATAAGFARLEQDVGAAADEASGLRQGLDAQRATFARLQEAAKVAPPQASPLSLALV